jgi:transcriptional regulator with XRE-family HTH domain
MAQWLIFLYHVAQDVLKAFGNRIKGIRIAKKLSQEQFAEQTGFHRNYIGMLERGERNISLRNIAALAKAMKIPIKDLLDF